MSLHALDVSNLQLSTQQIAALDYMRRAFASPDNISSVGMKESLDDKSAKVNTPGASETFFRLDDETFLRYLRACNYDGKAAQTKLEATVAFRKDNSLDGILGTQSRLCVQRRNDYQGKLGCSALGSTKDGLPLYMEKNDPIYIRTLVRWWRVEDVLDNHFYQLESLLGPIRREQNIKRGKYIPPTMISVIDAGGVGVDFHKILGLMGQVSGIDEKHYPETMLHLYVINAPSIFASTWMAIKRVIKPEIAAKVKIFDSNYKQALLDQVFGTVAELPVEWGGEKKGVFHQRPPEEDLLVELQRDFDAIPSLTDLAIAAGKAEIVEIKVDAKDDTTIQWVFAIEAYSIDVAVRFEPIDGGLEVLYQTKLSVGAPRIAFGSYSVAKGQSGILVLRFDNSFSWVRPKLVKFATAVQPFDEKQGDVLGKLNTGRWCMPAI